MITKYSLAKWEAQDAAQLERLYLDPQYTLLREYLEARLRADLVQTVRRLGNIGDVYFSLRIKVLSSVTNKIKLAIAKHRTQIKSGSREALQSEYYLHDFMTDVVGARIICVDRGALKAVVDNVVTSDSLRIVENSLENYRSGYNFEDGESDEISRMIKSRTGTNAPVVTKPSNYESVHCLVNFYAPVDVFGGSAWSSAKKKKGAHVSRRSAHDDVYHEVSNSIFSKLTADTRKLIRDFPIEVQIRTFAEHMWAYDDHRYVYSIKKASTAELEGRPNTARLQGALAALQFTLNSAETLRETIRRLSLGSGMDGLRTDELRFDIAERLGDFYPKEYAEIRNEITRWDHRVSEEAQKREGNELVVDTAGFLDPFLTWMQQIREKLRVVRHDTSLFDFDPAVFDSSQWGRQRPILLILAYIFLYARKLHNRRKIAGDLKIVGIDKVIGTAAAELTRQTLQIEPALIAARLYEHVRVKDKWAWRESRATQPYFFDPLVYTRLATARYRLGQFGFAATALELLFRDAEATDFSWEAPKFPVHSKCELLRRQLEYVWYDTSSQVSQILERMDALKAIIKDLSKEISERSDLKPKRDLAKASALIVNIHSALTLRGIQLPPSITNARDQAAKFLKAQTKSILADNRLSSRHYIFMALAALALDEKRADDANKWLHKAAKLFEAKIPHPPAAVDAQIKIFHLLEDRLRESMSDGGPNTIQAK